MTLSDRLQEAIDRCLEEGGTAQGILDRFERHEGQRGPLTLAAEEYLTELEPEETHGP